MNFSEEFEHAERRFSAAQVEHDFEKALLELPELKQIALRIESHAQQMQEYIEEILAWLSTSPMPADLSMEQLEPVLFRVNILAESFHHSFGRKEIPGYYSFKRIVYVDNRPKQEAIRSEIRKRESEYRRMNAALNKVRIEYEDIIVQIGKRESLLGHAKEKVSDAIPRIAAEQEVALGDSMLEELRTKRNKNMMRGASMEAELAALRQNITVLEAQEKALQTHRVDAHSILGVLQQMISYFERVQEIARKIAEYNFSIIGARDAIEIAQKINELHQLISSSNA